MIYPLVAIVYFFISVFLIGFLIVNNNKVFNDRLNIEKIVFSFAIGIPVVAIFSLIVMGLRVNYIVANAVMLIFLMCVTWFKRKNILFFVRENLKIFYKLMLVYFFVFISCILFSLIKIEYPEKLIDGPYVFKTHTFNTKIQLMTGDLPADNYVPYVFYDFLVRDISFKEERPMLPGQEVVNRTVMLGLVAGLYRYLTNSITNLDLPLGKFEYAGSLWPNVGRLAIDDDYFVFFVVAVALNAMIILGILLISNDFNKLNIGVLTSIFVISSPYVLTQIIFIWPKMLAGFYALLASRELLKNKNYYLLGFFTALSFHSHPMAQIYFLCFILYLCFEFVRKRAKISEIFKFGMAFLFFVLPWYIWTKLILKISSDLFAQNFFNYYPVEKEVNFLWIRVVNAFSSFIPVELASFPYSKKYLFYTSIWSLVGIIGLLNLPSFLKSSSELFRKFYKEVVFLFLLPYFILSIVFGTHNRFTIHGLQPHIIFLFFYVLSYMIDNKKRNLIVISFLINVLIWAEFLRGLGVFNYHDKLENIVIFSVFICVIVFSLYLINRIYKNTLIANA